MYMGSWRIFQHSFNPCSALALCVCVFAASVREVDTVCEVIGSYRACVQIL